MRYLVRMGFDDKTFTAAILDMAVKDYLSIKESGGVYTLKRSKAGEQTLAPEESAAAAKLFPQRKRAASSQDMERTTAAMLLPKSSCKRKTTRSSALP